jgi:hypothetical protein
VASRTHKQGGWNEAALLTGKLRRNANAIAAGLVVAFVGATVAYGTIRWQVVSSGSNSGAFAAIAIKAKIHHPKTLGIRLTGRRVQFGTARVACTRRSSNWSYSRRYKHAGTYKLPPTRRADSCLVTASVGGSGTVTVQILNQR